MKNELIVHPTVFLEEISKVQFETESEKEEAIFRLNEKMPELIEFLEHTLKESERTDFPFKKLLFIYDGSFGELIIEALIIGETYRKKDWMIGDVIVQGLQIIGLEFDIY